MTKDLNLLEKKLKREQAAREQAEKLLEEKSLELYNSNTQLKELNTNLEGIVEQRTDELRSSQLEYQTMVESISDMIIRLDLKGKVNFINPIVGKIFGGGTKKYLGKSVFEFIPKANRKKLFIHFARQYILRNCVNYLDIEIEAENKKKLWLRLNVQFSGDKCKICLQKQRALAGLSSVIAAEKNCHFTEIFVVAHDITQQKLAQEKLQKNEKKLRELTESLPEMICELDTKGVVTYANRFAINKFGYHEDEVLNGNFSIMQVFQKSDWKRVKSNIGKIFSGEEVASKEYDVQTKNGSTFPVIVYTTPMYELDKIVGLRGVMFDISDRKKQEQEIEHNLQQQMLLSQISLSYNTLSDLEEKTKAALQLIGEHLQVSRVYIFEDSADGNFTSNTYEWCSEGVDAQIEDLQEIPYDVIPSWRKMLKEDKIIFSEDINKLPKDIIEILEPQGIKSILVLPLTENDRQIGFVGFDENIRNRNWRTSEIELLRTISNLISHNFLRQRTQNNLVKSEHENRVIIDSIPDVIIHANVNGHIKSLKSAQSSNLSILIKNPTSDSIEKIFNPKLSAQFLQAIEKCLIKSEYQFEFKNLNWDELEFYEARLVKLNNEEVLIIIRDVTLIKENEKQLEIAKNKAEEASRMKSEFLANVSHEIRTPLNAILGFSQWLYDNVENNSHKGYLKSILNSGRSLLEIINDILELSKLESDRIDIELNPTNFREILDDIKMSFAEEVNRKGLTFKVSTEDSVPEYVMTDELRFYQIIFNLVSNAVKFTEKGYVHVWARAVKSNTENEISLHISVEDTGIGIKQEEQETIFDSFLQLDDTKTKKHGGTGLGLTIVDRLVKKLGGEIHFTSKAGIGSTFTIIFNNVKVDTTIYNELPQAEVAGETKNLVLGPCTIMIVDDVDYNREVLKTLVDAPDVKYIESDDGSDALVKLNVEKPDIIFMDIRMSGLDGIEATRLIKNDDNIKEIPIIAFSASTMKSRSELLELLFDDILLKPVFKRNLDRILSKFLGDKYVSKENKDEQLVELTQVIDKDQLEKLPEMIKKLKSVYLPKWNLLKGDLVIYEIEDFKNELEKFSQEFKCTTVGRFCTDLDVGLNTFDIELIEKKLNEFPEIIATIEEKSKQ